MKLKLPLLLLQAILLLPNSFADNVTINGTEGRQNYTVDTIIQAAGNSLVYDAWICPDTSTTAKGAIFHSTTKSSISFQGAYSLTISNGSMTTLGGFISASKDLSFLDLTAISFKNNTLTSTSSSTNGSLINAHGDILFKNISGNIEVTGNSCRNRLFVSRDGGIQFNNTGNITISNNKSELDLALLYAGSNSSGIIFANTGKVELSFNTGGLLVGPCNMAFTNIKGLTVEGNTNSSNGGAIRISSNATTLPSTTLRIENAGEVAFLNNRADQRGGAIAADGYDHTPAGVLLSADNGNIVFRGNIQWNDSTFKVPLTANAISFAKNISMTANTNHGTLVLRAQETHEITFYDPIVTRMEFNMDKGNLLTVMLNKSENAVDYNGIIRFDGSRVSEYITIGATETESDYKKRLDASRYSDIQGNTTLGGGSLILTNEVVYGRTLATLGGDTEFAFNKGTLELSNKSQLNATNFIVTGNDSVFRTDKSSFIDTKNFTANAGLSFDADYWSKNADANLNIKATNASFVGVIEMNDGIDSYSGNQWSKTMTFNLINAADITNLDDKLTEIQSKLTGSSSVNDPYQHKGEWSYKWVGKQLIATWTAEGGGISDVHPELEGNIVSNSMWSSASNVKSLSETALGNANILRLQSSLRSSFWVKGMGDFAYDDSTAELDGYSYQGGGYAAGADFKVGKQSLFGVAFGQLMGDNKSELYSSKIKQESMMANLYVAHLQTLNKRNSLLWTLAGTYGTTDNSMKTHYSDNTNSTGTWDNTAYFVEAKLEWRINPEGKSWTYKPFIGVEYTDVAMDSFTETGDKTRHFGEGSYKSLSLPIGIGFEHQKHFGKKTWLNSLSLAYVPDVYRNAPSTQATRLSNGFSWKDQGSKASIHTLRATVNSTLQLNAAWTAYAGYTFEAREGASYHNVNTGVSYSF